MLIAVNVNTFISCQEPCEILPESDSVEQLISSGLIGVQNKLYNLLPYYTTGSTGYLNLPGDTSCIMLSQIAKLTTGLILLIYL